MSPRSPCEYCPWDYFGNEASSIDLYTYAALHLEVPPFGEGGRGANKPVKGKPVKRERSIRKRKADQEQFAAARSDTAMLFRTGNVKVNDIATLI